MGKKIVMPKLNKIPARTFESIRKETSDFIFVFDKVGNAECERCNSSYILPKTKHLQDYKCPHCKAKLQIIHTWRRKHDFRLKWRVLADVITDTCVVLRYVRICRNYNYNELLIKEVARQVIDFDKSKDFYWELTYDRYESGYVWKRKDSEFFREFAMWQYRKECCLQADIHNQKSFIKELKKMSRFKYIDLSEIMSWDIQAYVPTLIKKVYKKADLYEMLQKAGYEQLLKADFFETGYHYDHLKYIPNEKTLAKKIGLTEYNFKKLKEQQNLRNYTIYNLYPDITDEMLDIFEKEKWELYSIKSCFENELSLKQIKYIIKNKINNYEYTHYFRLLKELNYPLTDYYLYPKDFRQLDDVVSKEYETQRERLAKKKRKEQSKLINYISQKLRAYPEIKELMDGQNGLVVYVPESAEDLVNEGKALSNCLGTYIDRVAERKTLIFYVRKLNSPNTPFVAMEISYNGELIQCRYNHNKPVDDRNIIDFASRVQAIICKHGKELKVA